MPRQKNELFELKRNETIRANNFIFHLTELTSNISSLAIELQTNQSRLTLNMVENVMRINDNHLLLLNLSRKTNSIMLQVANLTKDLSLVENRLESQYNSCYSNIAQTVQNQSEKNRKYVSRT